MWLTYVLVSAFILSFFDLSRKSAIKDNPLWPVLALSNCFGALFVTGLYLALGWLGCAVAVSAHNCWLLFLKSCLVTVEWSCTFYALRALPISSCVPVNASSPLWTLIGAIIVFHEIPSPLQGLGMLAIIAGYWLFAVAGKSEGINIFRTKGIIVCFIGVIAGACSAVFDKFLLQGCGVTPEQMQFWFTIDMAAIASAIALGLTAASRRKTGAERPRLKFRWTLLAIGVFLAVSDLLYFKTVAMPGAMISVVTLLRRLNVVFTFVLGAMLFHEHNIKSKALALAAIIAGAILLSL